jgi:O-antigen/teichoic acid export membrane protein
MASGGAEVVTRVLTVVLAIVTARMLEPVEVGFLGLSVIVIGVVSMLSFYPETAAIAARGEEGDGQFAIAAAGIRAGILACSLATLWLAYSAVAGYLTGNDVAAGPLRELVLVLAWMPVLELVSGYPQVVLQRRLELGFIARLQILQPVLFVTLAVALLITGHGYIGVAWATLATRQLLCCSVATALVRVGFVGRLAIDEVWRETLRAPPRSLLAALGLSW